MYAAYSTITVRMLSSQLRDIAPSSPSAVVFT